MKPDAHFEPPQAAPRSRLRRAWLLGVLVTLALLTSAALLAPRFIDSAFIKEKIQKTVVKQLDGQLDYQGLEVSILPRPAITLRQATLSMPSRLAGSVAVVRIVPKLLSLLRGELRLAAIELEAPEFSLDLPEDSQDVPAATSAVTVARPYEHAALVMDLVTILESLRKVTPTLRLQVSKGQLTVSQGRQDLLVFDDLALQVGLLVIDSGAAQATVQGELSALTIQRADRRETIKGVTINGSAKMALGEVTLALEQLTLAEPALALSGELVLAPTAPGITLNLTGRDIDVDATRKTALSLAGDNAVVENIFRYLRGGRVPQLNLQLQGDTPAALGDLRNLRIDGQLQAGDVSIPQIRLELTEVTGAVLVADGVLQGTQMSARLEGSTGHDGTLKVALGETAGLFQLELMLNADLAQAQQVLTRIVSNPAFSEGLGKITDLKGSGTGKLVLGDSLASIKARLEVTDFKLAATYQGVPLPIEIASGQLSFKENRLDIKTLQGRIGRSRLSAVAGSIAWEKALDLDLRAGPSTLELDELFAWLNTNDDTRAALQDIRQLSGQLELAALSVKGSVAQPDAWQLAARGSVRDVSLATPRLPATLKLARGNFTLAGSELTFQELAAATLDADLVLGGRLQGLPHRPAPLELSLEGSMGAASVAWLRQRFGVPERYALRTPLRFSATKLAWQDEATLACHGNLTVTDGPELTFALDSGPELLHLRQLTIKDRHSDASLAYGRGQGTNSFSFRGNLQHQSLDALFVEPLFGQGQLQGDISVVVPLAKAREVSAKGQLQGENLVLPIPDGDTLEIKHVALDAEGSRVKADVTSLAWNGLTWQPLKAVFAFEPEQTAVKITEARLCGIDSPGLVTIAGKKLAVDLTLEGKGLDVASSYTCLTKGLVKMTGTLDVASKISARGELHELVNTLKGPLKMTFSNGVIEQDKVLARLLEVLNVTEIVRGRLPRLDAGGFPYNSITVQGQFKDAKLVIEKLDMDGETLDILGHGELDIAKKSVNVELMAAPLKTADAVIRNLPGVNYLLAGTLVAIPVSVKGDLSDPKVKVLSISSVGSSLLGLGERTLKAPIKLIETILPGKKE